MSVEQAFAQSILGGFQVEKEEEGKSVDRSYGLFC